MRCALLSFSCSLSLLLLSRVVDAGAVAGILIFLPPFLATGVPAAGTALPPFLAPLARLAVLFAREKALVFAPPFHHILHQSATPRYVLYDRPPSCSSDTIGVFWRYWLVGGVIWIFERVLREVRSRLSPK
ncbi:hypothetical protein BYT27DRAFT_7207471 [Phlegmacium glaucopus]|nr:hypothetical protein BYT27DRAFT_7207471 [Phlegmacium glaucopus]